MRNPQQRDLIIAYEKTVYSVDTPSGSIEFKINKPNGELNKFVSENGASEWAFVTAFNPRSKRLEPEENEQRNAKLQRLLEQRHFKYFLGRGGEANQNWTPEISFFILDISLDTASEIAKTFDQNAIVWSKVNDLPKLVWCAT